MILTCLLSYVAVLNDSFDGDYVCFDLDHHSTGDRDVRQDLNGGIHRLVINHALNKLNVINSNNYDSVLFIYPRECTIAQSSVPYYKINTTAMGLWFVTHI